MNHDLSANTHRAGEFGRERGRRTVCSSTGCPHLIKLGTKNIGFTHSCLSTVTERCHIPQNAMYFLNSS
ncbi:Protein of unknown function [Pyronema omphalodes CBS 100304]|uniref:Uncharacterized protein n=1 Tax=Pyronema omphalodes (strain CBS 100304) TaxID=1076935 RepID=U4LGD3_PYROM|nr:Protein of unknown function [Pyronema omphalodes CBS 100304]